MQAIGCQRRNLRPRPKNQVAGRDGLREIVSRAALGANCSGLKSHRINILRARKQHLPVANNSQAVAHGTHVLCFDFVAHGLASP
jgi:hypothetical protein